MNGNEDGYTNEIFSIEPFSTIYRKPSSLVFHLSKFEAAPENGTATQPFDGRLPITLEGFDGETMTLTNIDYRQDRTLMRLTYNSPDVQSWIPYITTTKGEMLRFNTESLERISKNELIFEGVLGPINPDDIAAFSATTSKTPESEERFEIPLDWSKAVQGRR